MVNFYKAFPFITERQLLVLQLIKPLKIRAQIFFQQSFILEDLEIHSFLYLELF